MEQTQQIQPPQSTIQNNLPQRTVSFRNASTAFLFSIVLGFFAVDRFYVGRWKTGIIKLVTVGGFGIWALIDVILIGFGKLNDADDLPLRSSPKTYQVLRILTILYVLSLIAYFLLDLFTDLPV